MKKYYNTLVLLCTLMTLVSCEKEEIITSNNSETINSSKLSIKRINYDELVADQEFSGSLKAVEKHIFDTGLIEKNSGKGTKIKLKILTDEIVKIESEGVITWTFELKKHFLRSSDFENLLVKKSNNEFSYALVVYQNSQDNESGIEKAVLYPIPVAYIDTNDFASHLKDEFDWVPPEDGGGTGYEECEGVMYFESCSAGGNADGHAPQWLYDDQYCSGSPFYLDFSHCYDDENGPDEPWDGPTDNTPPTDPGSPGYIPDDNSTTDNTPSDPTYTSPVNEDGTSVNTSSTYTNEINSILGRGAITIREIEWLNSHMQEASIILSYLVANNTELAKAHVVDFLNITNKIPRAKFERYMELVDLIKNSPFALIEDCAQQNGLNTTHYQELYNHTLPDVCVDRLNVLGDNFQDQPINTGNAAVANVDYYGVEISTNPDFNLDGNPDTDAEVFNVYRKNFMSWASGSKEDFQFSCDVPFDSDDRADVSWTFSPYASTDAALWNSSNPLTAIIRIDANSSVPFGSLISDDGAIMISAITAQYWIGSTIATLQTDTQPFSGNRQWGITTNQNGNLELYTRAVDVARISDIVAFGPPDDSECKEDSYYNIGEATWSNLQEQIKQWINVNGGQATLLSKTAVRFDKTKLKEQLESNETIDQINCNE